MWGWGFQCLVNHTKAFCSDLKSVVYISFIQDASGELFQAIHKDILF